MSTLMVNGAPVTEAHIEERMAFYGLPDYMANGMFLYLVHRIEPGSFTTALLSNNLRESVACADKNNARCLKEWVQFMYCELPSGSWGSPQQVQAWLAERTVA